MLFRSKANGAVLTIRADLLKKGWKAESASIWVVLGRGFDFRANVFRSGVGVTGANARRRAAWEWGCPSREAQTVDDRRVEVAKTDGRVNHLTLRHEGVRAEDDQGDVPLGSVQTYSAPLLMLLASRNRGWSMVTIASKRLGIPTTAVPASGYSQRKWRLALEFLGSSRLHFRRDTASSRVPASSPNQADQSGTS